MLDLQSLQHQLISQEQVQVQNNKPLQKFMYRNQNLQKLQLDNNNEQASFTNQIDRQIVDTSSQRDIQYNNFLSNNQSNQFCNRIQIQNSNQKKRVNKLGSILTNNKHLLINKDYQLKCLSTRSLHNYQRINSNRGIDKVDSEHNIKNMSMRGKLNSSSSQRKINQCKNQTSYMNSIKDYKFDVFSSLKVNKISQNLNINSPKFNKQSPKQSTFAKRDNQSQNWQFNLSHQKKNSSEAQFNSSSYFKQLTQIHSLNNIKPLAKSHTDIRTNPSHNILISSNNQTKTTCYQTLKKQKLKFQKIKNHRIGFMDTINLNNTNSLFNKSSRNIKASRIQNQQQTFFSTVLNNNKYHSSR